MIKKTLQEITQMIKVDNDVSSFNDTSIQGVSIDSRKIGKGNLFVPFKGENSDGHRFVEDAIEKGAAAAFWQKDVPNPPLHLPILIVEDTLTALQELARSYRNELKVKVAGITGSNGKTTTKDMTANLLSLNYKVQKTEGNYNNHIGLPLTILALEEDTEIAVLEMGMSGRGEIDFLTKLARPDAVIITNIGESHLQDLGSREGIAEAKLEIINGLQENGLVIYYGDEPLLDEKLKTYNGSAALRTFGRTGENDVYPVDIKQNDKGSTFGINGSSEKFYLPVLGTHNVLNALAAMIAASHFGVPYEKMNEGFASLKLTNMRMELLEGKMGEKIINDAYNASPTSMNAAIELVANLPGYKKKVLVLGDMLELGPQEEDFHYSTGKSVDAKKVDYVFTFGKLGEFIAKGAKEVLPNGRVAAFTDKQNLIQELKKHVDQETIVLVKASRGMKLEEVVSALQ
ncbi:UDP-N-acetylmuramoyl-tripeptide--D-alanyl-D-alanine ligase [Cytobacillus firmus]|jgi:UDP-N-acetylmuramoyl-tripeptide--D-alanyl-D-alanine ligase|uniref:UDP-N-acetylmuramoyl-tripeptide--D-alanyl-D-alanine ligase n=1 Tax=Cytobacillus firmus TaxID=1399 RepID=A0AA46NZG2_CYTFI|nr:UDP-N-acetylmuramoyl-tripeptide--D-alanyl-D-alanine ligase [Cytobacillus firmus]KML44203.1 UDP-N-acetylmuramoyl-tripeptide--D-alanyl-D-alanine ligase [Cytobacillus firmus]MBG9448121.1 UDP-N-acetylmuramoyl-tripeptide--D-alanyl-D-alanine ligase [Cytobacillus firmus]MCS0656185.1 UDP-N-acetylmuramoyl-tripeptide--D-alanyl-D-alanine ligase [Cytobacillus firmus]MCU1808530.1 UDP-N-acetylmuramoyl-tripeptide--D-alanyl-D-alanine ligase [Cytobacillus firmus]USK39249.1 UDP-N-acetylmuramoyl-tripeptide--D